MWKLRMLAIPKVGVLHVRTQYAVAQCYSAVLQRSAVLRLASRTRTTGLSASHSTLLQWGCVRARVVCRRRQPVLSPQLLSVAQLCCSMCSSPLPRCSRHGDARHEERRDNGQPYSKSSA